MIKHILFDCDGVLVDTEITAAQVMVEAMQKKGADITVEYYLQNLSGSTFSVILSEYFGSSFNGTEKRDFIHALETEIVNNVKAISGVAEMLRAISLPKSIVSNSEIWQVRQEVERTNLDHFFTGNIFSSEQVKNPKPAPDVYELAIKDLQLNKVELLVVEDSITGAKAALAAGLKVIGFSGASHILPGHAKKMQGLGVVDVAADMPELGELLRRLITE